MSKRRRLLLGVPIGILCLIGVFTTVRILTDGSTVVGPVSQEVIVPVSTPQVLSAGELGRYCDEKVANYSDQLSLHDFATIGEHEGREHWTVEQMRGSVPYMTFQPTLSPNGKNVVYHSLTEGLVVLNLDSQEFRTLTTPPQPDKDYRPTWTSDSKQVVFQRGQYSGAAIFLINLDGSGEVRLSSPGLKQDDGIFQQVVPSGSQVPFIRSTRTNDATGYFKSEELLLVNKDGSGLLQMKINDQTNHELRGGLAVSPDGRFIAIVSQNDARHYTNIPNGAIGDSRVPNGLEPADLYLIDIQMGQSRKLVTMAQGSFSWPYWATDGHYLVYAAVNDGTYVIDLSGKIQGKCPQ